VTQVSSVQAVILENTGQLEVITQQADKSSVIFSNVQE
jgi:uncharacterized membrane protein YcaP (DUF421 family)